MFCEKCGNKLEDDAKFCPECGNSIAAEAPKAPEPKKAPAASKPPVVPEPAPKVTPQQAAQYKQYTANTMSLDDFLARVNAVFDVILMWFANAFAKKHKIFNEDAKGGACSTPQAYVLAPSYRMDLSSIKPKFTKSPYTNLSGILAVVVYGGLILSGVFALIAVVLLILRIIDLFKVFGLAAGVNGVAFIFGLCDFALFALLMFLAVMFTYKFFYKIKNKEVDFMHYLFKANLWCLIVYAIELGFSYVYGVIYAFGALSFSSLLSGVSGIAGISAAMFSIFGLVPAFAINVLITMCVLFAISIYFCKSIHLRTYMGTDAYLRLSQFTRTVLSPIPDGGKEDMNEELCNTEGRKPRKIQPKPVVTQAPVAAPAAAAKPAPAPKAAPKKAAAPKAGGKKFCGKCGAEIVDGNQFCTSCGAEAK